MKQLLPILVAACALVGCGSQHKVEHTFHGLWDIDSASIEVESALGLYTINFDSDGSVILPP